MLKASLPPLQKAIIKCLACKGPQTRNQVKENLGKDYHAILHSFNTLIKKELIREVGTKKHRGRNFSVYWLTIPLGIAYAFFYNISADILKTHALSIAKNEEDKKIADFVFEMAVAFGPMAFLESMELSKLEQEGRLTTKTLILKSIPLKDVDFARVSEVLKKYPEAKSVFKKGLKNMSKMLGE
jgi:hypothetical protein